MSARLRTRYGSCDQIMLPTRRLRGSSAVITIAPQPWTRAISTIFLAAFRVPSTWPSASRPQSLRVRTASSAFLRCSSHSRLFGISPGLGKPKLVPQMRAMTSTCTGAFDRSAILPAREIACGEMSRSSDASSTAFTSRVSGSGNSADTPGAPRSRRPSKAVTSRRRSESLLVDGGDGSASRLGLSDPLVLDLRPVVVERDVEQQHADPDQVVGQGVADVRVEDPAQQPDDREEHADREGDPLHELGQPVRPLQVGL